MEKVKSGPNQKMRQNISLVKFAKNQTLSIIFRSIISRVLDNLDIYNKSMNLTNFKKEMGSKKIDDDVVIRKE